MPDAAPLWFRVFGRPAALRDGRDVLPGPPDHAAVLAVLLLHRDVPVSDAFLLDAVWGRFPPPSPELHLAEVVGELVTRVRPTPRGPSPVERTGSGDHRLTGAGYHGMVVSMGRFAVLRCGPMRVLLTERPAWSADPGTWRHAGIDPDDVDVLVVRSCTDYLANFPASATTSLVADVPGAATPRLQRLRFERCDVVPYPVDPEAAFAGVAVG